VKSAVKAFLAIILVAFIALVVVGCDQKQASRNDTSQSLAAATDSGKQNKAAGSAPKVDPVDDSQTKNSAVNTEDDRTVSVKVFFCDDQGEKLVAESHEVDAQSNLPKAAIEQLIAGPDSKDLVDTIPEGTKLLDLDIVNGIAYANFSEELSTKHWGGSAMEALTVQSIVNTLTQFDDIKKVKILLDGSTAETIAGHVDISNPLSGDSMIGTP
jgi:germination protein M